MPVRAALAVALTTLALCTAAAAPGSAYAGCSGSSVASVDLRAGQARDAIRCLLNKERSARNLKANRDLQKAAQKHTDYMRTSDCFSHECPGEPGLVSRVKATGYSSSPYVGEVLAGYPDQASPRDIVRAWIASPLHKAQIHDRAFRHVGVGINVRNGSVLYTAVLGHR